MRLPLSPAASGLIRALARRADVNRDRILLIECKSVEWRSLTFSGERHCIDLRIPGADASVVAERIAAGIGEAELPIPGHVVAEIAVLNAPKVLADGSVELAIEALTIAD